MSDRQGNGSTEDTWVPPGIDTSVAHPARRYDYWLGGKDNYAADRASGDQIAELMPNVRVAALENRRFLGRAVGYLAKEAGIDQFLDIGTGIPAAGNTHEVAQRFIPSARVVYVDNDPLVLTYARALLTSTTQIGETAYIQADVTDPDSILADPALAETLDLSKPVALMLVAVLHLIQDESEPYSIVRRLTDALPDGSYLVISHATADFLSPQVIEQLEALRGQSRGPASQGQLRSRDEVARFFDGCDLVEPGLVSAVDWRPEGRRRTRPSVEDVGVHVGVGRIRH